MFFVNSMGNFIRGVPHIPRSMKLSSNKNLKSHLTLTPDNERLYYAVVLLLSTVPIGVHMNQLV